MVPVLAAIASITFVLMHFVPGGPWDREKKLPPAVVDALNERYGLNDPLWLRYWNFLSGAARGDLGVSFTYQDRAVTEIIRQGLPATVTLGGVAFLIVVAAGVPMGVAAAVRRGTLFDHLTAWLHAALVGVPGFVLGILLVIAFSVRWHLLPTGGWGSASQVIMPAVALAALPTAFVARVTRASVLEALSQDFVRTARAKGLAWGTVHYRHVLRNSMLPVITVLGPELAALIAGSFIIESVFSIPGVGRLFVQGVFQRDYGLIMGLVLFYSFVIVVMNLIVDLVYAAVDPRVRHMSTA